ncbi:MAG: serine acetyltransferase [Bradyrhizobium sp.]
MASAQELWRAVRREAEAVAAGDPVLAPSLARSILDHGGLGSAVARQIGQRLGAHDDDCARFERVANEAFVSTPELVEAACLDLQSIVRHDPAVTALLPPLLNFKGYVALQAWRVSNWLWGRGRTDFALMMQSASSERLQVSIHPSAAIGTSVFLDHATGIIIGALSAISDEVTIMQNVTIGRKPDNPAQAPRVGRGVLLSSGSSVIGDIAIGDFARIGAGAVVTGDVPAGCTAVGVPARLTNCPEGAIPA